MKKTPLEKRGNFLIIPETERGDRAAYAIPLLSFISAETGVEIWEGYDARAATVAGWTIDEILDLIEGPEPVKRAVPAEVEFDAEEITRIADAAVNRIIREHFPDLDKTTPLRPREDAPQSLRDLQGAIHALAIEKGWWEAHTVRTDGSFEITTDQVISKIALIHAELSEAVEEARKSPHYSEIYYESEKPEGFAVELADVLIRTLDLFGALGIDAAEVVRIKHGFNRTRPHRHGGKLA